MCLQRLSLGTCSISECLGGNVIASLSFPLLSLNFHKHHMDSFEMWLATINFSPESKGTNDHIDMRMSHVFL